MSSLFDDSIKLRDPSQQKRKKARTPVNIPGEFMLEGRTDSYPCTITDLGTGGMSFIGKSSLYVGDKLNMRFKIKTMIVEIGVSVIRASGKSIGVQITSISEEDLDRIQDYIHSTFF